MILLYFRVFDVRRVSTKVSSNITIFPKFWVGIRWKNPLLNGILSGTAAFYWLVVVASDYSGYTTQYLHAQAQPGPC